MGNCLKTQLKSQVSNSNLTEIGELILHLKGATSTRHFAYFLPVASDARIFNNESNAYFTNDNGDNLGNHVENVTEVHVVSGKCDVAIKSKYDIYQLNPRSLTESYECDLDTLSLCYMGVNGNTIYIYPMSDTQLNVLNTILPEKTIININFDYRITTQRSVDILLYTPYFTSNNVINNVKNITYNSVGGSSTTMTQFNAFDGVETIRIDSGSGFSGNFEDLGANTSLVNFYCRAAVGGSIEAFVAAQRAQSTPRTSCAEFKIQISGDCTITYNGTKLTSGQHTFSWDSEGNITYA